MGKKISTSSNDEAIKAYYGQVQAAQEPADLALALMAVFQGLGPKRADGTVYAQISTNAATEITVIDGSKMRISFNEAYRKAAEAKGWAGSEAADPVAVIRALEAENVLRQRWYTYPTHNGGKFNVCKIWLYDPNFTKAPKEVL